MPTTSTTAIANGHGGGPRPAATVDEAEPDTVGPQLRRYGICVSPSWLFDDEQLGIRNGWRFYRGGAELVYRCLDDRTVLIVLYRKPRCLRTSLRSSFTGIVWFMRFLRSHVPGVHWVTGS